MTLPEIKDWIHQFGEYYEDENSWAFKSGVVLLYGYFNDTVSAHKIKRGTDLVSSDVKLIMDVFWAKNVVCFAYWNFKFVDEEHGWMDFFDLTLDFEEMANSVTIGDVIKINKPQ